MPPAGYKAQVLEEVWRLIEDLKVVFQLDPDDDWVLDLIQ